LSKVFSLVSPLNDLVKKDVTFCWKEKLGQAFQKLKAHLTNSSSTDFSKTFELE